VVSSASFHPIRYNEPFILEAHVARVPLAATCKGLFITDLLARVKAVAPDQDLAALANVQPRRYLPFKDYPYVDLMRLIHAAAGLMHPDVPRAEGIRRIGQHAYDALLDSHIGRVIFGVLGRSAESILLHGPKGYKLALNFGHVSAEKVDSGTVDYHFRSMPALLDVYQPGVIEGAMRHCGVRAHLSISVQDFANADVRVEWS
jgi:uncharacterized protein (TIGR02265 family)